MVVYHRLNARGFTMINSVPYGKFQLIPSVSFMELNYNIKKMT